MYKYGKCIYYHLYKYLDNAVCIFRYIKLFFWTLNWTGIYNLVVYLKSVNSAYLPVL